MGENPYNRSGYVCSKAGFWKVAVIAGGCATFALYADSSLYTAPSIKTYVLAAYIISWAISVLIYFSKVTGLSVHMNTVCCSFNSIDYFWSWLSSLNYLSCSIMLACYFGNCDPGCQRFGAFCPCAKQLTALLLGFLTAILYVFEAQNLRLYAIVGTAYGTSWRGIWQMFILVVGGVAFGLLDQTNYVCSRGAKTGCTTGRTITLAVWCIAWSVTCLFYLLHVSGLTSKISSDGRIKIGKVEFFWSAFSCLLYLVGASVYAAFLECSSFTNFLCRSRLAADLCGFATAILFAIDAYYAHRRPMWLVPSHVRHEPAARSGGDNVVVTRTTETRTVRK